MDIHMPSDAAPALGQILIRQAGLSPDQLDGALKQQRVSGQKLGEILVEQSYVTRHQI